MKKSIKKSSKLGDRKNAGKPGMHLLPLDALVELSKIYDFGARKYAPHNWEKGLKWDEGTKASLLRHLSAWSSGEDYDSESGLPHDLAIGFNALALITYRIRKIGIDDRHKVKPPKRKS